MFQLSGDLAASDMAGHDVEVDLLERAVRGDELHLCPGIGAEHLAERHQLLGGRGARGHRVAVAVVMGARPGGREAPGARLQRPAQQRAHLVELGRADLGVARPFAQDGASQRGVAGQHAEVQRCAVLLDRVEVLGKRPPGPGDPGREGLQRVPSTCDNSRIM